MAKGRKIAGRRAPVKAYAGDLKPNKEGWIIVREKRTAEEPNRVVIADCTAWKAVRKKNSKKAGKPIFGYASQYHNRLLFNGNNAIAVSSTEKKVCKFNYGKKPESHVYVVGPKIVIADARFFKIVRKAGVKPLEVERDAPTPHPSHSMTRWATEARSYTGGEPRWYNHRHCRNCGHEQAVSVAGKHNSFLLTKKCKPNPNWKDEINFE